MCLTVIILHFLSQAKLLNYNVGIYLCLQKDKKHETKRLTPLLESIMSYLFNTYII